jgi:hypothetical protein
MVHDSALGRYAFDAQGGNSHSCCAGLVHALEPKAADTSAVNRLRAADHRHVSNDRPPVFFAARITLQRRKRRERERVAGRVTTRQQPGGSREAGDDADGDE